MESLIVEDTRPVVRNYIPPPSSEPYRIAIIGEAPGADEEKAGEPFVGRSGQLLNSILNKASILRSACMLGNVVQHRPPNNKIELFSPNGYEFQEGLKHLEEDIHHFNPHLCVLLGATALRAAKASPPSIFSYRSTLFTSDLVGPFLGRKCLASIHPAYILRDWSAYPLLLLDLRRARSEGENPTLLLPERIFELYLSASELVERMDSIEAGVEVSFDIEGSIRAIPCASISTDPLSGFIINFDGGGFPRFEEDEEIEVWRSLSRLMWRRDVPKVLQNSLYDRFVLAYKYHILIRNIQHDTMLKHWELYSELEKSLEFQCSIYTKEPFYKISHSKKAKEERQAAGFTPEQFWDYCCRDSAVTLEISRHLDKGLVGRSLEHYRFNMELLDPLLYMELRGIRYDTEKAKTKRKALESEIYANQFQIDKASGRGLPWQSKSEALAGITGIVCKVRSRSGVKSFPDLRDQCYKEWSDTENRIISLGERFEELSDSEKGELSILLDLQMNCDSDDQMKELLYTKLALPIQYKTDPKTKVSRPTTNYEALLNLTKKTKSAAHPEGHPILPLLIRQTTWLTLHQMLSIHADSDGRIRCGYNLVGTETGRLACYTSPTGSGYNLTTIPDALPTGETQVQRDGMRDLFLADEGHELFQCDLSGADSWTVAAWCNKLGDPTMLEDLLYGLKPAKILALMYKYGPEIGRYNRDKLKEMSHEIEKTGWLYFCCKQGTHGTAYLMGFIMLGRRILIESEGRVSMAAHEVKRMQSLFLDHRYRGIKRWHEHVGKVISQTGRLLAASGQTRIFFGRRDSVLGEALAFEPQAVTTYATNRAAKKLWSASENRRSNGSLIAEPLHQIHDALLGQYPISNRRTSQVLIKESFNNPIVIADQTITIPYEGRVGRSWGELKDEF